MRRRDWCATLLAVVCAAGFSGSGGSPALAQSTPASQPSTPALSPLLREAEDLYTGTGGRYDPAAAFSLFERAAADGEPLASFRLAILLHRGAFGMPKDPARATELHRRAAATVKARAGSGDAYAQYLVGTAALIGLGGTADPAAARPLLERAAAAGQVWAMHNLGWMYTEGSGVPKDPAAALRWLRRAADAGGVPMMYNLVKLLVDEDSGVAADASSCGEALRWLERAAVAGHAESIAALGRTLYFDIGRCHRGDPARALPWLERAAATQEPGTAYNLAFALLVGDAGRQDAARAAALLEQADNQKEVLSIELLAFLRATGVGIARDPKVSRALLARAATFGSDGFPRWIDQVSRDERARKLFDQGTAKLEALAASGDHAAQAMLARFLYTGTGVNRDLERADRLARTAAAGGDPDAMRTLGQTYSALGDEAEASRWWRRCAELGNSFCMMFYSQNLMEEDNAARDLQAGLAWLIRSAEAGNWWAAGDLGHLYDEGWYGLPRDEAKAAFWKRKRAALGDDEARGWLMYQGLPIE